MVEKTCFVSRYCAVFRVDKAMKACLLTQETLELHRGTLTFIHLCSENQKTFNILPPLIVFFYLRNFWFILALFKAIFCNKLSRWKLQTLHSNILWIKKRREFHGSNFFFIHFSHLADLYILLNQQSQPGQAIQNTVIFYRY